LINPEIQNKIYKFLKLNPEYNLYKDEILVSILLEKEIITKDEAEIIKNGYSLFCNNKSHNYQDYKEIMGLNLTSSANKKTPKDRMNDLIKNLGFIQNENGSFIPEDFTCENILKRFGKEHCTINEPVLGLPRTEITIDHPELGCIIIGIFKEGEGRININCNNSILELDCFEISTYRERHYDNYNMTQKLYAPNGQIYLEILNDKMIHYKNGYPYCEEKNGKIIRNLLLEDIIKDLTPKKFFDFSSKKSNIENNVLKRINEDNIEEILQLYINCTNNDLINDIKNAKDISIDLKNKLVKHLESLSNKCPQYLAQKLADDIYGIGSGDLENNIKKLNKDNIQEVLFFYKEISYKKDEEFGDKFLIPNTDLYFLHSDIIDYLNGGVGNNLIASIKNEWGITNKKAIEMINHIVDTVLESIDNNKTTYAQDIKRDILFHKNDHAKLDVDIARYANRVWMQTKRFFTSKANGKIDTKYQQWGTGDCWLISGLTSILNQKGGKEYLENLVKVDPITNDAIVFLPGANKSFFVRNEDIKNFTHLAVGDGDIRAIELAIDQYIKELAYNYKADYYSDGKRIDIDGNSLETIFNILLNNSHKIDLGDKNWYKEDIAAIVALQDPLNSSVMNNSKCFKVLIPSHAYSILKTDEEFLYLYDPNEIFDINNIDEDSLIKIPQSETKNLISYGGVIPDIRN